MKKISTLRSALQFCQIVKHSFPAGRNSWRATALRLVAKGGTMNKMCRLKRRSELKFTRSLLTVLAEELRLDKYDWGKEADERT